MNQAVLLSPIRADYKGPTFPYTSLAFSTFVHFIVTTKGVLCFLSYHNASAGRTTNNMVRPTTSSPNSRPTTPAHETSHFQPRIPNDMDTSAHNFSHRNLLDPSEPSRSSSSSRTESADSYHTWWAVNTHPLTHPHENSHMFSLSRTNSVSSTASHTFNNTNFSHLNDDGTRQGNSLSRTNSADSSHARLATSYADLNLTHPHENSHLFSLARTDSMDSSLTWGDTTPLSPLGRSIGPCDDAYSFVAPYLPLARMS